MYMGVRRRRRKRGCLGVTPIHKGIRTRNKRSTPYVYPIKGSPTLKAWASLISVEPDFEVIPGNFHQRGIFFVFDYNYFCF